MCHGRRDWSRASSEATDDEPETVRTRWDVRARERLREVVGSGDDSREESSERPGVAVESASDAGESAANEEDNDEREREGPISADD